MRPSCAAKAVRYRQFVGFREATSMRLRIVDFARVTERRDPALPTSGSGAGTGSNRFA
jgi:hypothetical protein